MYPEPICFTCKQGVGFEETSEASPTALLVKSNSIAFRSALFHAPPTLPSLTSGPVGLVHRRSRGHLGLLRRLPRLRRPGRRPLPPAPNTSISTADGSPLRRRPLSAQQPCLGRSACTLGHSHISERTTTCWLHIEPQLLLKAPWAPPLVAHQRQAFTRPRPLARAAKRPTN